MPYKTSQIFGIFYTQIGAHKSAKSNVCIIRFCPTFSMSYRNACPQQKCKKKCFVTICFGFRGKIAILTGLLGQSKVGGVIFKIFITR